MNLLSAIGVSAEEYRAVIAEVDEIAQFAGLTPFDRHLLWVEKTRAYSPQSAEFFNEWPVPIEHFVTDPYYVGADLLVRPKIKEFISDFWAPENAYEIFTLIGGLGAGKSFSASLCLAYAVYQLSVLKKPQRYLNRFPGISLSGDAEIVLMNASAAGARQASKVVYGEGLALDTPLPTPTGWTTMGALRVGDALIDEQGLPCNVTYVSPPRQIACYRVTFSDRTSLLCDESHRFTVLSRAIRARLARSCQRWSQAWDDAEVLTVAQLRGKLNIGRRVDRNYSIPVPDAFDLPDRELLVDPYILGAWLGDGVTVRASLCACDADREVIEHVRRAGWQATLQPSTAHLPAPSYGIRPPPAICRTVACERRAMSRGLCGPHHWIARKAGLVPLRRGEHGPIGGNGALRGIGVLGLKHIPIDYLRASRAQRLTLLQGLMDTDGYCANGATVGIDLHDERLAADVCELVRSLGWILNCLVEENHKGTGRRRWRMSFRPTEIVFRLTRKREEWLRRAPTSSLRTSQRMVATIEPVASVPTRCITVDSPRALFLAGEGVIPTHNTFQKVEKSPYFAQCFEPYQGTSSELEFPNRIRLAPGTSQWTSALGWNLWGFVVDEAAFGVDSDRADYVKELFSNLNKRRISRFKQLGFGGLFTSPGSEHAYVELIAGEGESWDGSTMVRRISTWEASDELVDGAKIFLLERHEPIRVLEGYTELIFRGFEDTDDGRIGVAQRVTGEMVRWKCATDDERKRLAHPELEPA